MTGTQLHEIYLMYFNILEFLKFLIQSEGKNYIDVLNLEILFF